MNAYGEFAQIYNQFMLDAPTEDWVHFLETRFERLSGWHVADLGCGTGRVTVNISRLCKSIVGVDLSDEMLAQAAELASEQRAKVQWLCQDIRELRLPRQMNLILSTCDSFNYLMSPDDVQAALARVYASLAPEGWFCCDMLGPRRIEALRDGFWYEVQAEAAILFESDVSGPGDIRYDLTAFVESENGLYRRFEEHHEQHYYGAEQVQKWLTDGGFVVQDAMGDFGRSDIAVADRLVFVAKKP